MGTIKVNNFDRAGGHLINIVSRKNSQFFEALWNDLVDTTPVLTGTARYSWILTAGNPSPRKPERKIYGRPAHRTDVWKYTYRWINWYIVNNQDYVAGLNNGDNPTRKAPIGWINSAIRRNVAKANNGEFRGEI